MEHRQESKKTGAASALRPARRTPSLFWIAVLSLSGVVFLAFDARVLFAGILSELRAHPSLLVTLAAFCIVAVSLVWSSGQKIDAWVFSRLNSYGIRPAWLDKTVRAVTELGSGMATAGVALVFVLNGNPQLAQEFLFGTLTLWLAVELIKALIRRPRPFSKLSGVRVVGARARGKSFPSGHTSQAFYIAAVIVRFFGAGWLVACLFYAGAFLVGMTRMYMGMHYPRDVLAGAILGSSWGLVGVIVHSSVFG